MSENKFELSEIVLQNTKNMQETYKISIELIANNVNNSINNLRNYYNIFSNMNLFTNKPLDYNECITKPQKYWDGVFKENLKQYKEFFTTVSEVQSGLIDDCINGKKKGLKEDG